MRVSLGNRPPGATPACSNVGELASRGAVEGQYPTRKILRENQLHDCFQGLPPSPFGQESDTVEELCLGDRRSKHCRGRLGAHPFQHSERRRWTQRLRQDVCIQNYRAKSGGSRTAPRGGNCSSTPPKGFTCLRIASTRFPAPAGSCAKDVRKMSRASSSIERLCCAARSRSLRFTVSSRFRIVLLATPGPRAEIIAIDLIIAAYLRNDSYDSCYGRCRH
jgi:hypothetical protein